MTRARIGRGEAAEERGGARVLDDDADANVVS
jgi:hypothetical protein